MATLLQSIALSHTTAQQLTVLELLALLEERVQQPRQAPAVGTGASRFATGLSCSPSPPRTRGCTREFWRRL